MKLLDGDVFAGESLVVDGDLNKGQMTFERAKAKAAKQKGGRVRNFLYFIGAGLSKALERPGKPIPLMYDFVSVMADYMGRDPTNVILTTLAELERARLYDWASPEAVQLADVLVGQRRNLKPIDIARFRRALRNRPFESIERLLEKSHSAPGQSADSAPTRFNYAINRLFCLVGWEVNWPPLRQFLTSQFGLEGTVHRFVSFNYDLVLDRAVEQAAGADWEAATGYGFTIPYWTLGNEPDNEVHPLPTSLPRSERVLIVKPNGSLNWLAPLSIPYAADSSGHKVADRGWVVVPLSPDGTLSYFHSTETFNRMSLPNDEGWDMWPCILPPTSAKASTLSFLRQTREQEERAIAEADEVYVIGWSMPESDASQDSLIRSVVKCRSRGIERVTVVNRTASPIYCARLASVFNVRTSQVRIYNSGFCEFVEESKV